jgi:hypothetical protein
MAGALSASVQQLDGPSVLVTVPMQADAQPDDWRSLADGVMAAVEIMDRQREQEAA